VSKCRELTFQTKTCPSQQVKIVPVTLLSKRTGYKTNLTCIWYSSNSYGKTPNANLKTMWF